MSRNRFTKEFKEQAVRLVLEAGNSRVQVCRDLGISSSALNRWIGNYRQGNSVIKQLTAEEQRIKELEKENRQLTIERDILKKATAFFSRDTL